MKIYGDMSSQLLDEIAVLRARIADLEKVEGDRQSAELALRESRIRLRTVVSNAPIVLFALDANGVFTLSEGKALELIGYKPGEAVGQSVFDIYKDVPKVRDDCRRALRGEVFTTILELPDAAFETRYTPLRNAAGEVNGCIGVATDITSRLRAERELRASEEKFRMLAENVPGVIYLCKNDERFTVIYLSEAMESLVGIPAARFLSDEACFKDIIHPDDLAKVYQQVNQAIARRETYQLIYRMVRADDRVIWVQEHGAGVFKGNELAFLEGYITDITDRIASEQALAQSREELERRVIERTANLKAANERNLKIQEELAHVLRVATVGELASGLAHELNQPLSVINNYVQGARRRIEAKAITQEELLGAFEKISAESSRAASILQSVRHYLNRRSTVGLTCDLNMVVRSAVELVELGIRDHQVELKMELPSDLPAVEADAVQIEQVILNLVRNGIEAMASMPATGRRLRIQTHQTSESVVQTTIEDAGPGLPGELAASVLKPFFSTKPTGMGMGLSISRSIIEAHGGRFWFGNIAESSTKADNASAIGGARFQFTLPILRKPT